MSDTVIRVDNLSKKYILGHKEESYKTFRGAMTGAGKSLVNAFNPRAKKEVNSGKDEFWALKDVSFEIKQGDSIGIIGRNGAGKSTLLKVLSRITEPTSGSIRIKGRVASLLEVGTGFHPELTGRENIFLNGAILGMGKVEIQRKFDEIVAFAEVEKFLDTPVKRYSSGMYVRLAFAVAAHLEPEILIVDEVLAVGDAQFQKKCLGKMGEVAHEGRTVIFVSHNMQAVSTLTKSCIFLNRGKVINQGSSKEIINEYLNYGVTAEQIYIDQPSNSKAKITKVEVITSETAGVHTHGEPFEVSFEISTPYALNNAALAFQIFNNYEQPIVHFWVFASEMEICRTKGLTKLRCKIPNFRLFMGKYTITVYFSQHSGTDILETLSNICPFEVVMYRHTRDYEWQEGSSTYLDDFIWEKK